MESVKVKFFNKRIIISLFILAIFYMLSFRIPPIADDFAYSFSKMTGEDLKNILDVLKSVGYEYMTWNGRILGYLTTQILLIDSNQIIFRIIFPLVNLKIINQVYKLIFDKSDNYEYLIVIFTLIFSTYICVLNQTMFWIIGWAIYVVPLIFLLPIINYSKNIFANEESNYTNLSLFLYSLIGCLYVEHYSLIVCGFAFFNLLVEFIRNKKITKKTVLLLVGSIMGTFIIFFAPGLSNRGLEGPFDFTFREQLHFGYSRFIWTYFYLNQRIILVLIILLLLIQLKNKNRKLVLLNITLLIPMLLLTICFILNINILSPKATICLTGEWSYYYCTAKETLRYSMIMVYYLVVIFFLLFQICLKNKSIYYLVVYIASILSSFVFVISTRACERTQFISFFLLVLITLEIFKETIFSKKAFRIMVLIVFVVVGGLISTDLIINYDKEYKVYQENSTLLKECRKNNCAYVSIKEHNYKYIFKSDIDFEDQNNWVINSIRKYYGLKDNVIIKNK